MIQGLLFSDFHFIFVLFRFTRLRRYPISFFVFNTGNLPNVATFVEILLDFAEMLPKCCRNVAEMLPKCC